MTTLVGKQEDFAKALYELCELDYDAIDAYEAAINRLEDTDYKEKLREFKNDHERHTHELTQLLKSKNQEFPKGCDSSKSLLAEGKVVILGLVGDKGILKAMKTNEDDTNTAYERLNDHEHKWPEANSILKHGLADERRHRQWIEKVLKD